MRPWIIRATTKGEHFIIDKEDLPLLQNRSVWLNDKWYLCCKINNKQVRIHKLILSEADEVDHINGITTDIRRKNLRPCTHQQNLRNMRTNRSVYKGVCERKGKGFWTAQIRVNGRLLYLGRFFDPKQAALAYNEAAIKHFGEFACLNIILEPDKPVPTALKFL